MVEAATAVVEQMNRYPDMGAVALYDALAARFGVPTANLSTATGSVALIYQILQAFCDPGDEVVYAWRSFEAYPIAVTAAAATSVQVPVTATGEHDLDAMAAAVTDRTKVVLVCTPNNPTGPSVTQSALLAFLARCPPHVLVVVDEAYVEFVRMDDAVDGLALHRDFANVVVTRTFSKAYGLASFRVGYAVAHEDVAGALRAVSLPFGVSGVAQAAADRLPGGRGRAARAGRGAGRRADPGAGRAARAGWEIPEAQGNFVWFPLGDRAADFAAACAEAGVTVRPFAGDGVRVSIGETEANDRIIDGRPPRRFAADGRPAGRPSPSTAAARPAPSW